MAVLTLVVLCLLGGCTAASDRDPATTPPPASASSATAESSLAPRVEPGSAASLLGTLAVKGRAPKTGYERDRFGSAWSDDNASPLGRNGCDTRNDILRRDLRTIALKPGSNGCSVLTGTLDDPYTASMIRFARGPQSADVQIDHVVALSNSWQTGAFRWTVATRTAFANDPLNLLAVDGPTNASKGDGDAATWLPPNKSYRCSYVARQVAVKARYGLWMTSAEHDATARILRSCPGRAAPTESPAARVTLEPPPTSAAAKPSATRTTGCTMTSSGNCIRGGQLCPGASYGRTGHDGSGRSYVCEGDRDRPHWERP